MRGDLALDASRPPSVRRYVLRIANVHRGGPPADPARARDREAGAESSLHRLSRCRYRQVAAAALRIGLRAAH